MIKFYIREDPYGFLSNFWRHEQTINNEDYMTNEHFYQSQKANTAILRNWIRKAPTAYLAMIAGRSLKEDQIQRNWNETKVQVMMTGLIEKFKDENLKLMLSWTGNEILTEDSPTDRFWGGTLIGSKNMLGKILMAIREDNRNGGNAHKQTVLQEYKESIEG